MRSNATPGPDGLNAAFYKASWNWSKQDVHQLVSNFYADATLPTELNQTFITLIPKKPNLVLPQDLDLLASVMSSTKLYPNPWQIEFNLIFQHTFHRPNQPLSLEDISLQMLFSLKKSFTLSLSKVGPLRLSFLRLTLLRLLTDLNGLSSLKL
jgi:hypothetical protein